jgi:hypothetical protein
MQRHLELDEESFTSMDIARRTVRHLLEMRSCILQGIESVDDNPRPPLAIGYAVLVERKSVPGSTFESAAPLFMSLPVFTLTF